MESHVIFGKRVLFLTVLFLFCFVSLAPFLNPAQQTVEEPQADTVKSEEESEKIVASPQNIKEETGIFVFVGWMWLSIFVLVFFLRLKIREADRLFHLKFFSSDKD
jgi:hypothetical protein